MNALEAYNKALRELSDRHAQELPRKLAEIDLCWDAVLAEGGGTERLVGLQRLAHGFDAACSVLGLPRLAEPSRRLADCLTALIARAEPLLPASIDRIEGLLADLRARAPSPDAVPGIPEQPHPAPSSRGVAEPQAPYTAVPDGAPPRVLYVFEHDPALAASLAAQLLPFGYRIEIVESTVGLTAAVARRQPYAILIDPDAPGLNITPGRSPTAALRATSGRTPLIYLSSQADVQSRVESVRAGAVAFFEKPVRITDLVDKLDALALRDAPEPYRVMIVDGDIKRAELCRAVLHEVGMEVCLVHDPAELVTLLGDFNPELLLISLTLPGCGGDEIAQVVHQMPSYVSLPVVFLSEHWNLDRQIGLMNVGGDALLPVPLQASQLIATVIARVERYRTLSALMQHDSLTGLLNHSRLHQYVEVEAMRAQRQSHPLSFAMLDIDQFKGINDRYGHPVGDRVLRNLARFLRQNLRKSDIVGRYGGEEFAVVLTDTDGPAALAVLEKLCADFGRVTHDADGVDLHVTFSDGVATMTDVASARDLILVADRALYEAKHAGRNRVVLWNDATATPAAPSVTTTLVANGG